jgi:hypothetical protein
MGKKLNLEFAAKSLEPTQAPEFALRGLAKILHLNLRKDKDTDELSVDIKLIFERCNRQIAYYFDPDLIPFLWLNSDVQIGNKVEVPVDLVGDPVGATMMAVKNVSLQPVAYSHEIHNVDVSIGSVDLNSSVVKKFSMLPKDGGVLDFTCSISCEVNEDEVATLSQYLSNDVQVNIAEQPKLI